jgi:hypothetical protein
MDGDLAVIARHERRSDRRWWTWAGCTGRIVYRATTTTRESRDAREGCDERPCAHGAAIICPEKGRAQERRATCGTREGRAAIRTPGADATRPEYDGRAVGCVGKMAKSDTTAREDQIELVIESVLEFASGR